MAPALFAADTIRLTTEDGAEIRADLLGARATVAGGDLAQMPDRKLFIAITNHLSAD